MSLISDVRSGLSRLDNSSRELKKFGLTMFAILALLSVAILIWGSSPNKATFPAFLALLFIAISFLKAKALAPVRYIWIGLSLVLGYFMSRIILSLVFYLIMTPINFSLKICGKRVLETSFSASKESYWIKRESAKEDTFEKLY